MSELPKIPYLQVDDLVLVGKDALGSFPPFAIRLKPFGALVALGVYVGAALAMRQGRRLAVDRERLASFIAWVAVGGFVLGHVLDALLYYPDEVARDPSLLWRVWDGLSSFGGFAGAILGAVLWRWKHGIAILPLSDVVAAGFPVGFIVGRAGCALVHDHPGMLSEVWFAVRFPEGGRLDLGLLELLVLVPIAAVFIALQRRPRPVGLYLAALPLGYAPCRFALDFLRARDLPGSDPRYGGLTPAQWGCLGLVLAGAVLFLRALPGVPSALARPRPSLRSRADPERAR